MQFWACFIINYCFPCRNPRWQNWIILHTSMHFHVSPHIQSVRALNISAVKTTINERRMIHVFVLFRSAKLASHKTRGYINNLRACGFVFNLLYTQRLAARVKIFSTGDILKYFLILPRKQNLPFHANCLQSYLEKNTKNIANSVVCWISPESGKG